MAQARRLFLYLLPLALFVALTLLLSSGIGKDPTFLGERELNKPLPEFSKKNLLQFDSMITEADFEGPALINFFGSWCPPCYHEHPYLMKLSASGKIPLYGINYNDERPSALKFINEQGNPYRLIAFDDNGRLGIEMGIYGAPETFLINKEKQIIYRHVGVMSESIWQQKMLPLLSSNSDKKQVPGSIND